LTKPEWDRSFANRKISEFFLRIFGRRPIFILSGEKNNHRSDRKRKRRHRHADKLELPRTADATIRRTFMLLNFPTTILSADPQLALVRAHFNEHGPALCHAAELIDGMAGGARVLRLMSALREASRLDRTIRCRLVNLHRLLSLDPIIEEFEPDLTSWMHLDPASDEVAELCLLTDRLYDLLVNIGELDAEEHMQAIRRQKLRAA
jgi:hypothetical protein